MTTKKKKVKEEPKKENPLDNIIPDPNKVIENLTINASFVTSLQQVLVLVMSTATEADQITTAYRKINDADIAAQNKKEYTGEVFNSFEASIMTLITLIGYLRQEVIKQKAYAEFSGTIDKEGYSDELKSLLSAAPEDIDEEMNKLASKMAEALGEAKPTEG
jgi:hypothetical protein|tara:strand:- start:410 stop:895 length:486 start_codon:yes stop_codon:yes gene_type:complete